jgi:hypothetical protein
MNGQKRNHKINQLMHNDNSNCYDIEKESNDSFFFVTDNGVRYVAEFTNNNMGMDFNESKILEFSFYHSDKSTNHDKKVSSTIAIILKPYLNDSLNIVYYICDQTDGKHHARRRLFLRWYRDLSTLELVLYETKVTDNEWHTMKSCRLRRTLPSIYHKNHCGADTFKHTLPPAIFYNACCASLFFFVKYYNFFTQTIARVVTIYYFYNVRDKQTTLSIKQPI